MHVAIDIRRPLAHDTCTPCSPLLFERSDLRNHLWIHVLCEANLWNLQGLGGTRLRSLQADYLDLCRRLKELRVSFDRPRKGGETNEAYDPAASLLPRRMRLFVVTELKVPPASKPGRVQLWCTWDEV